MFKKDFVGWKSVWGFISIWRVSEVLKQMSLVRKICEVSQDRLALNLTG